MALVDRIKSKFTSILTPHFLGREQESLVELAGATLEEAQVLVDEGVEGIQEQINDFKSEYGAGLIGIEDLDGHFSSTNVEGALQELATSSGNFDPSDDYDITGYWTFENFVTMASPLFWQEGAITHQLLPTPGDALGRQWLLPDQSGTVALLENIPDQVDIQAGDGIDVSGTYPSLTITNTIPQLNLSAGSNINITGTYPNLIISATGGSGGGDVTSVNGQVGDVLLTYSDVGAAAASHTHSVATTSTAGFMSAADKSKLNGIASGATNNAGTVTSVNVTGGTGLDSSGGPITGSGTITLALSTNLQSWSGITPSSKANDNAVLKTTGNQSASGTKTFTGNVIVDGAPVRRTLHTTRNSSGNLTSSHLNSIVEKTNNSSYTYTLTSSLGDPGDIITLVNSGTGGNMTIAAGSGTTLWRNGSSGNIVVGPGSMVSVVKTNASGRWQA